MSHPVATDVLTPGGGLDRAIPHCEDRAEPRAMSFAVAPALTDQRPPDQGPPWS